jgi:hypothetical protein
MYLAGNRLEAKEIVRSHIMRFRGSKAAYCLVFESLG